MGQSATVARRDQPENVGSVSNNRALSRRLFSAVLRRRNTACEGCPPLQDLVRRYAAAGGRYLVCPICFEARHLDKGDLLDNAELGGTVPMWEWIGDHAANTFSY